MSAVENAAHFTPEADDVFARIASRYDFLSDIFSLYCQRYWKARMATRMAEIPAEVMLDVASGTGDIPLRLLRHLQRQPQSGTRRIWITDVCAEMLDIARRKIGTLPGITFDFADAHDLSTIPDASVDLYSMAFGMKICDRNRALPEAFRVLKPGGRFFCLEAAAIPVPFIHRAYLAYMNWCLPLIARLVTGGDKSAYDYLLRGIHAFPDQHVFAREIESHGFESVGYENLTFGIVALHYAHKPLA